MANREGSSADNKSYEHHGSEQSQPYHSIEQHIPVFRTKLEDQGRTSPNHMQWESSVFLKYCRMKHGFSCIRCESCGEYLSFFVLFEPHIHRPFLYFKFALLTVKLA